MRSTLVKVIVLVLVGTLLLGTITACSLRTGSKSSEKTLVIGFDRDGEILDTIKTAWYSDALIYIHDRLVSRDYNFGYQPGLAESWDVSEDGLTWTFTLKDGIKYSDGTPVVADDIAYAVKRSFAFTDTGPTYQVDFLKAGAKYEGPWDDANRQDQFGDTFAGVEAKGNQVIFHLEKRWETLPYFASFTQASPIQKAKETKNRDYGNTALSTGPYVIKSFTQGTELTLVRNPNWDPNTDAARKIGRASCRERVSFLV